MTMSSFLQPKSRNQCRKNFENRFSSKKSISKRPFACAKEVIHTPENGQSSKSIYLYMYILPYTLADILVSDRKRKGEERFKSIDKGRIKKTDGRLK